MSDKNTETLVVVQNPNSTNYKHVERQVLTPLRDAGVEFDLYNTQYADAESNASHMAEHLPDNARVLSAAGDGTGEQVVNASLKGNKNFSIGFLPFGNFNDLAHAHISPDQTVLDMIHDDVPTTELTPLTLEVDGEYWLDAASYASFGLTAIIASGFRSQEARDRLRAMPKWVQKAIRNGQSGVDYLRYMNQPLPDFRVDRAELKRGMTDIAFSNNPLVAGIIRAEDTYYDKPYFGALEGIDMGNPRSIFSFGVPSLLGRSPLERTEAMHVAFETEAMIPVQIGGEYHELISPTEVFVYKDPAKKVRVLHPAGAVTASKLVETV